jgi:hypothetical protein
MASERSRFERITDPPDVEASLKRAPSAERALVTRCAWCERYLIDAEWVTVDAPWPGRLTHGICPDCAERLKEAGQSR